MNKYLKILTLAVFIFNPLFIYSQDTLNDSYFNNLRGILLKEPDVEKIKFVQKYLIRGKYFKQELFVKYKGDNSKRYWRVGRDFGYDTKNNKLIFTSNVDIKTRAIADTSFSYDKNGEIAMMRIYNTKYPIISIKKNFSFFSIFCKYYENTPSQFKRIVFCNGKITYEETCTYIDKKGFVKDGEVIFYKEDGTKDKIVKYNMGEEIR